MSKRFLLPIVAVFSIALLDVSIANAQLKHPKIHKAIYEMEQAEKYLNSAPKVFGTHKEKAIEALGAASIQLKEALDAVGEKYTGWKGKAAPKGSGPHPRLTSAINDLNEAKAYLETAEKVFKGHKAKAIKDINVAITQLEEALAFAAKKGK